MVVDVHEDVSFIHSFLHSFIPSFLHSSIPSFVHSFIHSFIPFHFISIQFNSFIHSFSSIQFNSVHSFISSFVRSFVHSFIHSVQFNFSSIQWSIHFLQRIYLNSPLPSSPTIPISKLFPIVMSYFWNFRPNACQALPGKNILYWYNVECIIYSV